jgi:hypothetical protein
MRHLILVFFLLSIRLVGISQVSTKSNLFYAKEFSKEIALYNAKIFVLQQVLGISSEVVKFEIDPLAAASSGELTSLAYKCGSKNKQGLILGFYGTRWNDAGVIFQGYDFLNLPSQKAQEILSKIDALIEENNKFLSADDANNLYFQIDDITFIIYRKTEGTKIRVLWSSFDSEWDYNSFKRTKKRLEKQMN